MDTDELYNALGDTPAKTPVFAIDPSTGLIYAVEEIIYEPDPGGTKVGAPDNDRVWLKLVTAKQADLSTETSDTDPQPQRCPRCGSPDPRQHPAIQFEGEVQPCPDAWHTSFPIPEEQL